MATPETPTPDTNRPRPTRRVNPNYPVGDPRHFIDEGPLDPGDVMGNLVPILTGTTARLDSLMGQIAGGMGAADAERLKVAMRAELAYMRAIGRDPADPFPSWPLTTQVDPRYPASPTPPAPDPRFPLGDPRNPYPVGHPSYVAPATAYPPGHPSYTSPSSPYPLGHPNNPFPIGHPNYVAPRPSA